MSFVLTCLLIYLLFILLRPLFAWGARRFIQHQANRIFGQQWGGQAYSARSASTAGNAGTARRKQKKKVFDRGDGEYVEFEEIQVTREESDTRGSTSGRYVREEQVSDAEWTEIK